MVITKEQIRDMIEELPEEIEVEELIYRLYLRQKLESAEEDVRQGKVVPHQDVVKEISDWSK